MEAGIPLSHEDYTVGWICALPIEIAAAKLMLDTIHPNLPRPPNDRNTYILGNIGEHNVVITGLPSGAYGNTSATSVGMQLQSSFSAVRIVLMVGIGGGVPSNFADIRLGDIVVSQPSGLFGGVVQYDLGKVSSGGNFERTGMLNRPPKVLLTALATLQAHHLIEESRVVEFVSSIQAKMPPDKATIFARPTQEDCLYQGDYDHIASSTCLRCDKSKLCPRPPRDRQEPVIHYGLIGSANRVVRDGRQRDQLARDLGIYCVEMEAAGLMNDFPCLVVRGICDYADSHKNKVWQGYAAAVAAAYAKELLLIVPTDKTHSTLTAHTLPDSDLVHRFDVPLDLTAVPVIENFLGRQDELDQLWQYLRPRNPQSRKVAILHGLGGIGKTQLAIHFARSYKNDFTAIFWLSGKDRGTLLQSLSSILPRLPGQSQNNEAINKEKVERRAKNVLRWLALEGNSRWLIIFDNIDQYSPVDSDAGDEYDIVQFFPPADHGSILLTSRLQRMIECGKPFQLKKLDSKDAVQLLLQSTCLSARDTVGGLQSDSDTLALASRLDGLPLAIVIAGAFMRETGTSATDYLQYYQESWSELQLQSNPQRQYQQGNLLQTWMISYCEIQKRDPDAAKLLLLFAHFDNRDIWYELIKGSQHSSVVPVWLERSISSGLAFTTGVKNLIGFSMLETKEQVGSYALHPVVQDWCIHLSSVDKNADSTLLNELAVIAVGYSVPSSKERDYSELQQRLIPHANYVRHRGCSSTNMNIAIWEAFHGVGRLYSDQGRPREAEEMYQRALVGKEKAFGPDHMSTLTTVGNIGNLYSDQSRLREAEEMYQRALVGKEKAFGPDHTSTLNTVSNLGNLYRNQGRLREAEEMYQRALVGKEKAFGPNHASTLNVVGNIGNLYSDQGRLKEAEEMYQRALAGFEKAFGPDHTSTLHTIGNLGALYSNQGRLKKAEEMYQRALVGFEKALGPDHPSTLHTFYNLGTLYSDLEGRLQEAKEMYQRALVGFEKVLGPDHTSTLDTLNNLGILYTNQGRLKEAEEMYQRARVNYRKPES
ncbi:Nephrocystin-3 [Penicillium rolfsii]|nr:Nephrocystin-3 [Penicillium rolfsii]